MNEKLNKWVMDWMRNGLNEKWNEWVLEWINERMNEWLRF